MRDCHVSCLLSVIILKFASPFWVLLSAYMVYLGFASTQRVLCFSCHLNQVCLHGRGHGWAVHVAYVKIKKIINLLVVFMLFNK